jgi:predicted kinase
VNQAAPQAAQSSNVNPAAGSSPAQRQGVIPAASPAASPQGQPGGQAGGTAPRPIENQIAEFNRKSSQILQQNAQILQMLQQQQAPQPQGMPPPFGPPQFSPPPQQFGVPPSFQGDGMPTVQDPELQALERRIVAQVYQNPPPWMGAFMSPVLEVRQQMAAQQQAAAQAAGRAQLEQIKAQHPVFADPTWGRHAQRELADLYATQGRTVPLEELAAEAARRIEQDRYSAVSGAAQAAQQLGQQAQGAAATAMPGQGAGPAVLPQQPRTIREASQMARQMPNPAMAGR